MAYTMIAAWKQNGSLKTDLHKYVDQRLTREEILSKALLQQL